MKEGDFVVFKNNWKDIISDGHYDSVAILKEFKPIEDQSFIIRQTTAGFNLIQIEWMGEYYWGNCDWFEILKHSKLTDYCYSDFLIDTNTKGVV